MKPSDRISEATCWELDEDGLALEVKRVLKNCQVILSNYDLIPDVEALGTLNRAAVRMLIDEDGAGV